jgi:hypothetical protein
MDVDQRAEQLIAEILAGPGSHQTKLGQTILAASCLVGAGAALLQRISANKNGPDMDLVAWSEEVTKLIIKEARKSLRH